MIKDMMKRTISHKVLLRLAAQADEADIYNDITTSNHLTDQIEKFAEVGVRSDDAEYEYSKDDLLEDIKEHLWDIFSRVCDYYEQVPDGREVEEVLSFEAGTLLENLESLIKGNVGAHEPAVPGEEKGEEVFEVSDEFALDLDDEEKEKEDEEDENPDDEDTEEEDALNDDENDENDEDEDDEDEESAKKEVK